MVWSGRGRKVVVLGRMEEYVDCRSLQQSRCEAWKGEEGGGDGQDGGVDPLQQSQVMVRPGRGRKVVVMGRMGE